MTEASYRTQWSSDHGEDGLRDDFKVVQADTGEEITGTGELVRVMRPESDQSAYYALRSYAHMVSRRAPRLARELLAQLDEIGARQGVRARKRTVAELDAQ